jgi:hypothetical protein
MLAKVRTLLRAAEDYIGIQSILVSAHSNTPLKGFKSGGVLLITFGKSPEIKLLSLKMLHYSP